MAPAVLCRAPIAALGSGPDPRGQQTYREFSMHARTKNVGDTPAAWNEHIEPITLSVLIRRFQDISNEMTLTLEYTARSTVLALARDFSCAVYDGQARQIAMMDALPGHTASMHLVLGTIAERFEGTV